MRGRIDYRNPKGESLTVKNHDLWPRDISSPRQPHKEGARRIISPTLLSSHPWIPCWDARQAQDAGVFIGSLPGDEHQGGEGGEKKKGRHF